MSLSQNLSLCAFAYLVCYSYVLVILNGHHDGHTPRTAFVLCKFSILLSAYDNRKSVCRRTRLLQMPKVHSKAFVDNRKSMLMTIRSVFQRMRFLQLYTQMRSSTTGSRAFFTCIFFKEWKQFYSPPFPESQLNYPLNRSYRCQEKFNDCLGPWCSWSNI